MAVRGTGGGHSRQEGACFVRKIVRDGLSEHLWRWKLEEGEVFCCQSLWKMGECEKYEASVSEKKRAQRPTRCLGAN